MARRTRKPGRPRIDGARFVLGGEEFAVITVTSGAEIPAFDELTAAEREVCRYLVEGSTNAAIARARGTSVNTVENQISSIFRKLGVSSRSELAAVCR